MTPSGPATGESDVGAESARRPAWRNPYVVGGLLGLVLVSLLRLCSVRRPDPPPVLGDIPAFTLTDAGGATVRSRDMLGVPWVLVLSVASCEGTCRRTAAAAGELATRMAEAGWETHVALLDVSGASLPEAVAGDPLLRWSGGAAATCPLVLAAYAPLLAEGPLDCDDLHGIAHGARAALVDGRLRLRGVYELNALGLDEVYHRTGRVALAEWREAHGR